MPSFGKESKRQLAQTPPFSWGPLYPHISPSIPPHKRKLPSKIQPYWDVCHNLSCIGEALVYGSWILTPHSLYSEDLNALHSAHQGISSLKAHTQTCVYWHGMSTGIVNCCQRCSLCDAIIIILPASITCLPTTNTNTCSGWLHPLGKSALSGVICRPIQWLGWVCVWTTNRQKWHMVVTESCSNGLVHLGSTKKYQTRTPAFWDTPTTPWLPILMSHIRSQVKRRQSQNWKLKKIAKNSNFENLQ